MSPSSPTRLFELGASAPDDAPLLIWQGDVVTHGEMRARAGALAAGLASRGIVRGDRVALWLPNDPSWFEWTLACSRLGAAVLSLNVRLGAKEAGDLIARTGCKAVVLMPGHRDRACVAALRGMESRQRASLEFLVHVGDATERMLPDLQQIAADGLREAGHVPTSLPTDPCLLIATSGTTSLPKLVVHVQESVCRHAGDVAAAAGLDRPGSKVVLALPLCGAFGYAVAVAALHAACPIVLMESFDPAEAAALIVRHNATSMLGTNDMLDKLLDAVPGARPFPSLRMFGHANFVPSLTELPGKAEARGVKIRGFYGMSELLAGFASQPAEAELTQRAEAGGVPSCAVARFRIVDPATGEVVPDGQIGELQIDTPNRLREYFGNPKATADAFTADGFFRTGDLAYRVDARSFNFTSRMNDVLRIGGYLVSPAEIEDVVSADPTVETCQVVAVTRPQGVRPVAFVIAAPGATIDEAQLLALCRERLAIYKVPVRVFTVLEVPMVDGPNGRKVLRNALRDQADALFAAEESGASPARTGKAAA